MQVRGVIVMMMVLGLSACEPMVDRRGHIPDDEAIGQITEGASTRDDVLRLLGSPSSTSTFGEESWYYVQARKEAKAFLRPEVTDQKVMQVTFDEAGTVKAITRYDEKDSKQVVMVERVTPTEGHSLGFFEQVLGNLGRFNKPREMAPPGRR